ncbi:hypothetical protein HNQ50_002548 [Silvimonas terrae]|uniref:Uncharacterized protein n=1 Tax=Silvimonas terrae TaxID=300266 RepID=A0A840RH21_9NEIS|nr:hypothetical protein [Silvimonas terrae]MBB5191818.1 hypothetical protein [Silvimonas terrae]
MSVENNALNPITPSRRYSIAPMLDGANSHKISIKIKTLKNMNWAM